MAFELIWHPHHGLTKRFSGWVSGNDMLLSMQQSEADARFDSLRYVINDFLGIDGVLIEQFPPELIDEIAATDMAAFTTNPNIRIAVVAVDPDVLALAQSYIDSELRAYPTRLFNTLADARAWLELEY
jgi:hypothetical protein